MDHQNLANFGWKSVDLRELFKENVLVTGK